MAILANGTVIDYFLAVIAPLYVVMLFVGWSEKGKSSTRNSSSILKVAYGQHGRREYFFNTNFFVLGPPHII